jgi:enoyl-CoA hydratase/carnithine racemase
MDQLVLKFVRMTKLIIHVDSGEILSPFMNLSLACDYRIISENSIYENPYLDLSLVPKGGSAFFLTRLLGFQKAHQVLLSKEGITPHRAKQLGIVDEVVPTAELLARSMEVAKTYAEMPRSSISGIKKIMNASIDELERCLEIENELIFQITNTGKFYEMMTEDMKICR